MPQYQEGFDVGNVPPYQESFSLPDEALIGGLAVLCIGLIILAFFTGGQSLLGFAFI